MNQILNYSPTRVFAAYEKLLALSWKQPFGSLMLHGKIETRTWPTNYRGWVLMCASKKGYSPQQILSITGYPQYGRISALVQRENLFPSLGAAFAIGSLVDCRKMRKEDEDACFVEYYPDLYCHVYEQVQAIQPFPWRGQMGWREVTQEQKEQIIVL